MPEIVMGKKYFKEADLKEGSILTLLNPAQLVQSKYPFTADQIAKNPSLEGKLKDQLEVEAELNKETKILVINQMSYGNIKSAWGTNSDNWVGKQVVCKKHKKPTGGYMTELEPVAWEG